QAVVPFAHPGRLEMTPQTLSRRGSCVVCGTPLGEPQRSRYCSNACRQRAYRMRAASGQHTREPVRPFATDIPGALPALLDSFVGGRQELDRLQQLLRRHRMVTLVGSAGVGKTRLALELAGRMPGPWSGRAALVGLDAISDGELVPQAVAFALGLRGQPG